MTDVTLSPGLSDRIAKPQGEGLADAASEAAIGGAQSLYSAFRFSWLGYRRLFGVIRPEEETERLSMRENLMRTIDTIANLDADTARHMAEAFVGYFDARHSDFVCLILNTGRVLYRKTPCCELTGMSPIWMRQRPLARRLLQQRRHD